MKKWLKTTADELAGRFENPFLRSAMHHIFSPVLYEMMVLSVMDQDAAGYPAAGVSDFAGRIEKRYLSLGGEIHYRKRVTKIIVKNHAAVGLEFESGEQRLSDIIVSAADGKTTLEKMLDGKYTHRKLAGLYAHMKVNSSRILIFLGIADPLEMLAYKSKYILEQPLVIADGTSFENIDILKFSAMPDIVTRGKSLVRVEMETHNGDFWINMRRTNKEKYTDEKEKLAGEIKQLLERRTEGIGKKIEMVDVATPATFARYTGNWKGSIQGWQSENLFKSNPFRKELKGLSNFYMCGQWVEPGCGVPIAALSGRNVSQIICKKNKKSFAVIPP
ncbi:MAG: hypothetical protein CMN78_03735 [Spirochaetales bacterium]|nr:hypothetical protein [Spirochaetales bacterium]